MYVKMYILKHIYTESSKIKHISGKEKLVHITILIPNSLRHHEINITLDFILTRGA